MANAQAILASKVERPRQHACLTDLKREEPGGHAPSGLKFAGQTATRDAAEGDHSSGHYRNTGLSRKRRPRAAFYLHGDR